MSIQKGPWRRSERFASDPAGSDPGRGHGFESSADSLLVPRRQTVKLWRLLRDPPKQRTGASDPTRSTLRCRSLWPGHPGGRVDGCKAFRHGSAQHRRPGRGPAQATNRSRVARRSGRGELADRHRRHFAATSRTAAPSRRHRRRPRTFRTFIFLFSVKYQAKDSHVTNADHEQQSLFKNKTPHFAASATEILQFWKMNEKPYQVDQFNLFNNLAENSH